MTTLTISDYRDSDRRVDRHGIAADFVVKNRPKGEYTIVQNISVDMQVTSSSGKPDKYIRKYSELWHVPKKDRYTKQTDTFAVPLVWREDHKGYYQVEAIAYLVKKRPTGYKVGDVGGDVGVERDERDEPWGTTPGTWTIFKPDASKILGEVRRVIRMEWDNTTSSKRKRKKRKKNNLAQGEDLKVVITRTAMY